MRTNILRSVIADANTIDYADQEAAIRQAAILREAPKEVRDCCASSECRGFLQGGSIQMRSVEATGRVAYRYLYCCRIKYEHTNAEKKRIDDLVKKAAEQAARIGNARETLKAALATCGTLAQLKKNASRFRAIFSKRDTERNKKFASM